MLSYILALIIGLGSIAFYMAAFFFPEVYRKGDFVWSGVGFFYALILWFCAGRFTGAILLGQTASVALIGWLGWQTLRLRRETTPLDAQTPIPDSLLDRETKVGKAVSFLNLGQKPAATGTSVSSPPETDGSGLVSETIVSDTEARDLSTEEITEPVEETPVEETLVEETLVEETLVEETAQTPVEETPVVEEVSTVPPATEADAREIETPIESELEAIEPPTESETGEEPLEQVQEEPLEPVAEKTETEVRADTVAIEEETPEETSTEEAAIETPESEASAEAESMSAPPPPTVSPTPRSQPTQPTSLKSRTFGFLASALDRVKGLLGREKTPQPMPTSDFTSSAKDDDFEDWDRDEVVSSPAPEAVAATPTEVETAPDVTDSPVTETPEVEEFASESTQEAEVVSETPEEVEETPFPPMPIVEEAEAATETLEVEDPSSTPTQEAEAEVATETLEAEEPSSTPTQEAETETSVPTPEIVLETPPSPTPATEEMEAEAVTVVPEEDETTPELPAVAEVKAVLETPTAEIVEEVEVLETDPPEAEIVEAVVEETAANPEESIEPDIPPSTPEESTEACQLPDDASNTPSGFGKLKVKKNRRKKR